MCEERPYNEKSDMWALGCLTYELCTLSPPFVAANQLALARKITNSTPGPLPAHFSMELQFLVMKVRRLRIGDAVLSRCRRRTSGTPAGGGT